MHQLKAVVFLLSVALVAGIEPALKYGDIVNFMNTVRRLTNPVSSNMHQLTWSEQLASLAQEHADGCSLRKNKGLWIPRCEDIGQLIDVTPHSKVASPDRYVEDVLTRWRTTGDFYQYTWNVCENRVDCRPYTQMVWAATVDVGCGINLCNNTKNYFFVCLFAPGGNVFGLRPFLQGPPCTGCRAPPVEVCTELQLCRCINQSVCGCPDPFEMGGGSDPHFSVRLASGQLLCFSVQGEAGSNFNLISTDTLEINTLFTELPKHPSKTWLGQITVKIDHRCLVFNATSASILIDGKMNVEAHTVQKIRITFGRLYFTVTKNTANRQVDVEIHQMGIKFSVFFVNRNHLDLLWLSGRVDRFSRYIHGLLGQFLRPDVHINESKRVITLPGQRRPQALRQQKLFSFIHRENPKLFNSNHKCWTTMKPSEQGVGLIEGSYLDYKVLDPTIKFKFKARY